MSQLPNFDSFAVGDRQVSADVLNELADRVRRLLIPDIGTLLDVGLDYLPQVFVAKITAVGSAGTAGQYGWTEQRPKATTPFWEDRPQGLSGTTTTDFARALDGSQTVPVNSLVIMFPGWATDVSSTDVSRGWTFLYISTTGTVGAPFSAATAGATLSTALGPGGVTVATLSFLATGLYHVTAGVPSRILNGSGAPGGFNSSGWALVVTAGAATIFGPGIATPVGFLAVGAEANFDHSPSWFITVTTAPATIQVNYNTAITAAAGYVEIVTAGGVICGVKLS